MARDKVNILLVDDQPAKLLTYDVILRDLGENLIGADSARSTFEHLLKRDVAVVLLDVKRAVDPREIVNGVMYVLSTGCQWRYVPKDLPPKSTLFGYFDLWNWDGTLDRIHHALYVKCREAMDRAASPAACVIDSQSVKCAEKGGTASIRAATMRARRSRARSAISSSIR